MMNDPIIPAAESPPVQIVLQPRRYDPFPPLPEQVPFIPLSALEEGLVFVRTESQYFTSAQF